MLFNSLSFLIFLPVVTVLYFLIPQKARHLWLLASSYYFYMCWNARYALLILSSTVITYACSLWIDHARCSRADSSARQQKAAVTISLVLNLSILFFFKYFNFAFDLLSQLFRLVGVELNDPAFDVLLPVGISFYTFQALGYTIDVYRGDIPAEKNFFRYALFVSFFPQLVAGPIERSRNLLNQLRKPTRFSYENAREGLLLMLWGFFLKIVVADRTALFVDRVYGSFRDFSGWFLIIATILFAVQIYCDFYGYSVIAMGCARMLGIQLMENFQSPYLATSVSTFWRRWHISLTSWFKDYLYIPLGGSRRGMRRKQLNKLVVFLVSGLWHGADISFVVWGAINGLYQVLGEVLQPVKDAFVRICRLNRDSLGHKLASAFITFVLIDFSWIFFRANNFMDALRIIKRMLFSGNPGVLFDGSIYQCGLSQAQFGVMIIGIFLVFFADFCKQRQLVIRHVILKQDAWFRVLFVAVSIFLLLLFGIWGPAYDQASFIYFQF